MSAIKAGDLVMVVRAAGCCGFSNYLGHVFIAANLSSRRLVLCKRCKVIRANAPRAQMPDGAWVEIDRLKKIDPPAQDETKERREELHV